MAVKRVEFLNREQNIRGVLYLHKKAPLIVLCHGFTADKDVKLLVFLSKFLYNNGYSVFRFDFRGSGESGGEFTGIDAEISDLKQVMKFVKPYSKNIILIGHSFGSSIIALSKIKAKTVVMINPALSAELTAFTFLRRLIPLFLIHKIFKGIDGIADKTFENIEATGKLMKSTFRFRLNEESLDESRRLSVRIVKNIHAPIFFIQGTKDRFVHVKGTEQAFNLAHNPKQLFLVEGANHTISAYKHKLIVTKKILGWLTENGLKGYSKK